MHVSVSVCVSVCEHYPPPEKCPTADSAANTRAGYEASQVGSHSVGDSAANSVPEECQHACWVEEGHA